MANYLTQQDVSDYGSDLVDFAQRAAVHALGPHLQQIQEDNVALRQRLARESRARLDAAVERAVPNYREIDQDPRWHRYLLTVDPLSGRIRQHLLNDAIALRDANRVVSFFRVFSRAQVLRILLPDASSPNKPIYTRAQIAKLYDQHRRGAYRGREAEWARQDAEIVAASAEGRILGGTDVQGK